MDVGLLTETGFDICDVAENDQLLLKTDENGVVKTRWIFKNVDDKIIIHERSENHGEIAEKGTYLEIGISGYAVPSMDSIYDNKKIAKLLATIDWADTSPFFSKNVEVDGEVYLAVLAPVKLL
jgi:hypothetical protein